MGAIVSQKALLCLWIPGHGLVDSSSCVPVNLHFNAFKCVLPQQYLTNTYLSINISVSDEHVVPCNVGHASICSFGAVLQGLAE